MTFLTAFLLYYHYYYC